MSDRCYLSMTFRKTDKELVEEVLGIDVDRHVEDSSDDWIKIVMEQANYSMQEERETLARRGCVFFGENGAGIEYDAYEFAAMDGRMNEVLFCHEGYVVQFDVHKGKPATTSIVMMHAFLRTIKKVKKLLKHP